MNYYIMAFQKYADSEGRSSRRELIWFLAINWLIGFVLNYLGTEYGSIIILCIYLLYALAVICPNICLQIRRLHDVGKSGGWWWSWLIPILNFYLIYLLFFKRGDPCANQYGPPVRHYMTTEADMPQQNETMASGSLPAPAAEKHCFCMYCGAELSHGARFCRMCGAEVVDRDP